MPPSFQHSRDGRMGSIRSHEYQCEVAVGTQRTTIPQPVSEIRVDSVLTLDRAASPNRITTATRGTPAEGYLLVTIDKSLHTGQPATLVVSGAQSLVAQLRPQDPILFPKVIDEEQLVVVHAGCAIRTNRN